MTKICGRGGCGRHLSPAITPMSCALCNKCRQRNRRCRRGDIGGRRHWHTPATAPNRKNKCAPSPRRKTIITDFWRGNRLAFRLCGKIPNRPLREGGARRFCAGIGGTPRRTTASGATNLDFGNCAFRAVRYFGGGGGGGCGGMVSRFHQCRKCRRRTARTCVALSDSLSRHDRKIQRQIRAGRGVCVCADSPRKPFYARCDIVRKGARIDASFAVYRQNGGAAARIQPLSLIASYAGGYECDYRGDLFARFGAAIRGRIRRKLPPPTMPVRDAQKNGAAT